MGYKKFYGVQDARSMRGILSRGPARYTGPSKSPNPGNVFNIQRAAKRRLKKVNDMRRFR